MAKLDTITITMDEDAQRGLAEFAGACASLAEALHRFCETIDAASDGGNLDELFDEAGGDDG